MNDTGPEVVIIGAGPGGMFLAYLLATNGVRVHVLERHPDFRREFRGEGIQPSVVRHLEQLGMLEPLLERRIAVRARKAEIFLDGQPVVTLGDDGKSGEDFGIVLHQEGFLAFLDEALSRLPTYRLSMGTAARDVVRRDGRVVGVEVESRERGSGRTDTIEADFFVVASGRGTALRARAGLEAHATDTWFNILWMLLDLPEDPALQPQGFRAYLDGDSLFILYRTAHDRLQVAWGRRDERGLTERDFAARRARLLAEIPAAYRDVASAGFRPDTRTQLLKVASDRLARWYVPGMLFLGDAAHTMSPVAGQGINLAMRDAVVAANHILAGRARGDAFSEATCAAIQAEREPEVVPMQTFQAKLGYFMLGAPRWQSRAFFRFGVPLLDALGVRRRLVRRVQHGVTQVEIAHPVQWSSIASNAARPGASG